MVARPQPVRAARATELQTVRRARILYAIVLVLSLLSSAMSLALETVRSNIVHVQNGRIPNASAAVFPIIPVVQGLFLGGAWLLNLISPNLGFYAVFAFFSVCAACWSVV